MRVVKDKLLGLAMTGGGARGADEQAAGGLHARGLRLAARWAVKALSWARVQLWIEPDNTPSLRVARAAGFVEEGVLRSYSVIDGRRCDAVFFSLLPTDIH